MADAPLLAVEDLHAGYLGIPAVRRLSLTVDPGEVVALLGPNGAGKTTTLSTIAGLLAPISGSIRLGQADITGRPAYRLARDGVSLVPEDRALFYGLTVRENLRLARGDRTLPQGELLEILPELEKCLGRRAGVLSGGEQQMLVLARALVAEPKVLLIDELSMGLAPVIVQEILGVVRRIAREKKTAIVLVEQHVHLALQTADRAMVLAHGDVVLEDSATALRDDPERLRASYLGKTA
jgi:branched-chain amino acid transport system ATP-binding protein